MSDELDEYAEEFSEPTVGACARHAGRTFADEWVVFLLVGLVVGAVAVFQDALLNCGGVVGLAGFGLLVLIAGPLKWGYRYMCLRAVSGHEPHADDVLRPFDRYYEVVVAHFMVLAMLAGAIPLGLGVLPALIWWDLTVASLYHATLLGEAPPSLEAPLTDPSIA